MNNKITTQIHQFCEIGDGFAKNGDYNKALDAYWKAYDLIPAPKTDREITTWVLTDIGDANFLSRDFQAGKDNLSSAMHCHNAIGNPFLHLRLGQCQFEIGNMARAANELTRAYATGGMEIFSEEHPKYLEFLKTKIDIE